MAFEGGPLNVIGIKPEGVVSLVTSATSSGTAQAVGRVWQGSGQSFFGSAAQGIAGGLAGSAVNVALNSAFGTSISGPQGFSLDSGENVLASVITPQVTGAVAAGINQQIQQTLQNAGPFGPLLSDIGTGLVNQAFNGLTNSIFGATDTSTNYTMFPGGGKDGEAPADYGGSAYTLSDVVFSIQPANQGPQAFGDFSNAFSNIGTSLPFGELANADFSVDYPALNGLKESVMKGDFVGDVVSTSTGLA